MARKKKIDKEKVDTTDVSFGFFKQELEGANSETSVMTAAEMLDPDPNWSGSFNLDNDLYTPFPEGRVIEVFGPEGTCKTTLTLEVAGRACQSGKNVLYINMEKNLNLSLLRTIRSLRPFIDEAIENLEKGTASDCPLWIVKPTTGEGAMQAMRKFAEMVPNGIAILDSVDAAQPEAVMSGEIGDSKVGNLPKLMSDAMRKLIGPAEVNRVTLIFVNQVRDKITMYGDPSEPSGGKALRYYASQRIKLQKPRKADYINDAEGNRIGVVIRYVIVKNKVAPDGQEGEFAILFKNGIFKEREIISQCLSFGILQFGGRGGKQVKLPVLNRETGEFKTIDGEQEVVAMKQFDAVLWMMSQGYEGEVENVDAKMTDIHVYIKLARILYKEENE